MLSKDTIIYVDSIQDNFDKIYVNYFTRLHRFAKEYVMSDEDAENIVQDVFMMLWEKREVLNVQISLTAYLFSLVKNKCIDHLRRKVVAEEYRQELNMKLSSLEDLNRAFSSDEDIERFINDAINKLPKRCREIFIMSRIEGKKYQEIAEELNISVNTVENQMSIALKKLRIELKEYLPLLLFLTGVVK
ncbi:MAG: RNA polymerase sigma-70 factor [Tannerellaceae bacterium]|jgi:RNA polymerase sigma-70 factor (ECF subfamily)|nr:RNA polymerase sigma-70 factor [Tannerellaceae bacterium]